MKKEVKIIVLSQACCGKSTIAKQIYSNLKCVGFKNVSLVDDVPNNKMSEQQFAKNFSALICDDDFHISIVTQQVAREESHVG